MDTVAFWFTTFRFVKIFKLPDLLRIHRCGDYPEKMISCLRLSLGRKLRIGRVFVLLGLFVFSSILWAEPPDDASSRPEPPNSDTYLFQLVDQPLTYILLEYEKLSGNRVIVDAGLEGVSMTIDRGESMSRADALDFLEKSLLLNGVAIIPAGVDFVKAIPFQPSRQPNSEAIPLVISLDDLPKGDAIATYVMRLKNLAAAEAVSVFQNLMPPHPYGKISPVEGSNSIIITESASVIRQLNRIKDEIDLPPEETIQKAYQLERADATTVATAIIEMLGFGEGNERPRSAPPQAGEKNAAQGAFKKPVGKEIFGRSNSDAKQAGAQPVIRAIPRTNRIVVVARPVDQLLVEQLVDEFDAPAPMRRFFTTKLQFINVVDFLPVARDAILRGMIEEGDVNSGQSTSGGVSQGRGEGQQGRNQGARTSGGGGDSALSRGLSLEEPDLSSSPVSELVGKTLLVGDPSVNQLSVSGPPEHIEAVEELLKIVDRRPRQVYISTVIGQLTLGDDIKTGVDILRTVEQFDFNGQASRGAGILRNRTDGLIEPGLLDSVESFLPATAGLTLYGEIGRHLNVFVSALEKTQRFKVLSRPSIIALNNRRAVIATGQRIAVPTSTLTSLDSGINSQGAVTANIDYRDVVLKLEVVPLINSESEVTLTISQVNDEVIGSSNVGGNDVPTIGTQEMVTTVIVPTGRTILLGGLVTETMENTRSGLPFLMNVPILKHLFGSTDKKKKRKELVIFLQPHIINDEASLGLTTRDLRERAEVFEDAEEFVATAEEPPAEEGAILPEKSGPSSFPDGITGDETEVRQGKTVSPRDSRNVPFLFRR